jgi:hypothetical protein
VQSGSARQTSSVKPSANCQKRGAAPHPEPIELGHARPLVDRVALALISNAAAAASGSSRRTGNCAEIQGTAGCTRTSSFIQNAATPCYRDALPLGREAPRRGYAAPARACVSVGQGGPCKLLGPKPRARCRPPADMAYRRQPLSAAISGAPPRHARAGLVRNVRLGEFAFQLRQMARQQ